MNKKMWEKQWISKFASTELKLWSIHQSHFVIAENFIALASLKFFEKPADGFND